MSTLTSFNDLIKTLKIDSKATDKPLKIALLAEFASQHLTKALNAAGRIENLNLDIWEAEYDAINAFVMNSASSIYKNEFQYIIILFSSLKAYKQFSADNLKSGFAAKKLAFLDQIVAELTGKTNARIIISNYPEYDDGVFGNFANKTPESFLYQMRKINMGIMELATAEQNLFVTDVQSLQTQTGRDATFDPKLYIHGDIIYSLDFMAQFAINTIKIINAAEGRFKKCVIIDLDNTMWGGIIGDDGIERIEIGDLGIGKAFTALQYWLRNLKDRGIILAVCSKNTEHIAKEPFEKHAGMVLRLSDISVFVANWDTKVDNIAFIRSVLNISFDSMVFLDDNPFERNIVRQNIPDITVPELPEDPAEYLTYLQSLNLFETASYTSADIDRTRQYQEAAGRAVLQKAFASESEFLQSLDMKALVKPIDKFSLPRVAQLTQRSNQFNLRTIRYSEQEIAQIAASRDYHALTVNLRDIYGDYGIISIIILHCHTPHTFFIDTWIMSCRVLKRGVEQLVLNEIIKLAKNEGISTIVGEYAPTMKNGIVANHYPDLGFVSNEDGSWLLDVANYSSKECFITIQKEPDVI